MNFIINRSKQTDPFCHLLYSHHSSDTSSPLCKIVSPDHALVYEIHNLCGNSLGVAYECRELECFVVSLVPFYLA